MSRPAGFEPVRDIPHKCTIMQPAIDTAPEISDSDLWRNSSGDAMYVPK